MTKNQLRTIYKNKRNEISASQKSKLDDLLLIQFQQFDLTDIKSLFTYWPMEIHSEPNVELMTRYIRLMIPGVSIAYPVINPQANTMKAIIADEFTDFSSNKWGMMEPVGDREINANHIDLIFVPLLAFDLAGGRVGYGKGFYDRFLSYCQKDAVKIGFSYFDPVDQITDTNQFDVPLNYCITPQHIYEF